jgi:hypothetical protein
MSVAFTSSKSRACDEVPFTSGLQWAHPNPVTDHGGVIRDSVRRECPQQYPRGRFAAADDGDAEPVQYTQPGHSDNVVGQSIEFQLCRTLGQFRCQPGHGRSYVPMSTPRASTCPAICLSSALAVLTWSGIGLSTANTWNR